MNYYVTFQQNIPISFCECEYILIEKEGLTKVSKEEYYALRKSVGIIDVFEPSAEELRILERIDFDYRLSLLEMGL